MPRLSSAEDMRWEMDRAERQSQARADLFLLAVVQGAGWGWGILASAYTTLSVLEGWASFSLIVLAFNAFLYVGRAMP